MHSRRKNQNQDINIVEKISAFDEAAFVANYSGMEDLMSEIVEGFFDALPVLMSNLENAIRLNNITQIHFCAHTLHGTVSNFFSNSVNAVIIKIKNLESANLNPQAHFLFIKLEQEILILRKELIGFLEKRNAA